MHGTPVEVRKNPKATTWYSATMLDINGDNIRVGFEEQTWPTRNVPAYCVRRCPLDVEGDHFDPKVEEVVEVLTRAESSPAGWALGRVTAIKKSFYSVGLVDHRGAPDLIVERGELRRVSYEPCIDTSQLVRRLLPLEPELHSWIRSRDSAGCMSHVQNRGRLLVVSCLNASPDATDPPRVLLVGDERAVDLGDKLLSQIHFKNQIEMQRHHEQREQLAKRLDERQRWYRSQHREVFTVEQPLVGKVIGKKGENVILVRERYNVEITVQDAEGGDDRTGTTITVTGQTKEAARNARDELEYVLVKVPVESHQIGWVLGRGLQNITDISKKTELHYARFDDRTSSLELCGLRHRVEDAKLLIAAHSDYLPIYQHMDEEQAALQEIIDQLDDGTGRRGTSRGAHTAAATLDDRPGRKGGSRGKGAHAAAAAAGGEPRGGGREAGERRGKAAPASGKRKEEEWKQRKDAEWTQKEDAEWNQNDDAEWRQKKNTEWQGGSNGRGGGGQRRGGRGGQKSGGK
mmetsp:Transcript_121999/g.345777  ORF Transcript_121999/g.345777 Transcript_121999/m.345777 type:complete len:517 (+) Transcript_121999:60-1610(+)